ncbi:MAG TPA: hypothetical protein VGK42_10125 [Candidatus Dormibacteraeota bacterium]|jgi:hypothetical protein
MTTKRSTLTTDPLPAPVEPPIDPIPPLTDADRAWERLQGPGREKAQAEQAAVEAERRQRQDGAAELARALRETLAPLAAALAIAPPVFTHPTRERNLGVDLIRALDHVFQQRQVLVELQETAARTLSGAIDELTAPVLLPPERLEVYVKSLGTWRDRLMDIDGRLATQRRFYRELATVAAAAGSVVGAYRQWAEEAGR